MEDFLTLFRLSQRSHHPLSPITYTLLHQNTPLFLILPIESLPTHRFPHLKLELTTITAYIT